MIQLSIPLRIMLIGSNVLYMKKVLAIEALSYRVVGQDTTMGILTVPNLPVL